MDYIGNNKLTKVSLEAATRLLQEKNSMAYPDTLIAGEIAAQDYWNLLMNKDVMRLKIIVIEELPDNLWLLCNTVFKVCIICNVV